MMPKDPMSSSLLVPLLFICCLSFYGQCATISITPGGTAFQDALDVVNPGDVIELGNGDYWEDLKTRTDGTVDMPITIRGAGGTDDRENVVLRGAGTSTRVLEIKHDYYIVEDFTVNGDAEDDPDRDADSDSPEDMWRDVLIYAVANREPTERDGGYVSAIDGLVIRNMAVTNAGGECIRLRDHVTYAEVYSNYIIDCGIYDYREDGDGKNGEGVYVGTSSNQWDSDNNWDDVPDVCMGNIIRDNYIRTRGNEGIDVKEGSVDTLIEYNEVYMQYDDDSGGIGSRGDRSIIRYNHIEDTDGAGVRLGGHTVDGIEYGKNNQVYGNTMVDCRHSAVKVMVDPQGQICDNDVTLPDDIDEDDYEYSGGDFYYDPLKPCDASPSPEPGPTPTPVTPPPEATPEPTTEPPTTESPTTESPTTESPTTESPTTKPPTTEPPTTESPTTEPPTTESPTTESPTTEPPTTEPPTTESPTTESPTTEPPTTESPTTEPPTTEPPTTESPTTEPPTTEPPTTEPPTTEATPESTPEATPESRGTCSDGIEGIDGNGVVCCPLGCGQCAGSGCSTAGAANGLTSSSCCGGGIKSSGNYCDDTGVAPCIYGSAPDADGDGDDDDDDDVGTCNDGIEGIDGNGVVCCPLGCGQCAGSGCSTAGAANGLTSSSCCGGGIKSSGNYCDDTGVAPCIYGSAPDADDDGDDDDDDDVGTCSDGIEGIDGNGVVCCPLGCGQCVGSGCSTDGAANGLTSSSCCGGEIKSSGNYCDDTGVAPCIYGSAPDADDDGDDDDDGERNTTPAKNPSH
ncbi:unnamed protein product [Ectocarpus sp. CCAP 1310/34]|nr:unnamed protein product [Ectocarpus sp. CCAP 1310/34]